MVGFVLSKMCVETFAIDKRKFRGERDAPKAQPRIEKQNVVYFPSPLSLTTWPSRPCPPEIQSPCSTGLIPAAAALLILHLRHECSQRGR